MKNCANCYWNCSNIDDTVLSDEYYQYEDTNYNEFEIGDCTIQKNPGINSYCPYYSYKNGERSIPYVFYDEQYLGPGYFIIYMHDEKIEKFIKISSYGEGGFPFFLIRAFEQGSIDRPNQGFRSLCFPVTFEDPLYNVLGNLKRKLKGKQVKSVDPEKEGMNSLQVMGSEEEMILVVNKDIYGVREATNYIDISIGDFMTCECYSEMLQFYRDLEQISMGELKQDQLQKIFTK